MWKFRSPSCWYTTRDFSKRSEYRWMKEQQKEIKLTYLFWILVCNEIYCYCYCYCCIVERFQLCWVFDTVCNEATIRITIVIELNFKVFTLKQYQKLKTFSYKIKSMVFTLLCVILRNWNIISKKRNQIKEVSYKTRAVVVAKSFGITKRF
jgi:hypothetical protein